MSYPNGPTWRIRRAIAARLGFVLRRDVEDLQLFAKEAVRLAVSESFDEALENIRNGDVLKDPRR